MIIILKRITKTTRKYEIEAFIEPTLKGGLLKSSGYIESISIRVLKDTQLNLLEYYGLVGISPDAVAKRAIKKLNGKQLNGQQIGVSAFFVRDSRNERRTNYRVSAKFLDKRKRDRRRPYLEKVENIYIEIGDEAKFKKGRVNDTTPGKFNI